MVKLQLLGAVVTFALWVFCLVDVIGSDESRIRNLSKIVWLLVVLLFPFIGSVAWLVAGRPEKVRRSGVATAYPEYDRPGRMSASDPAKDEEFLRRLRERAEEQRRRHEQEKRASEQDPEPEPPVPGP
ncbi:PLD nuclease N-terminal domain-containing protein [Nocardioides sp. cx-173]|uniref:PLD nuclease N-terminal domain-containing protein n=1 Tax=Nocardioides sp. cx-173 TaxID=2898796 RepID=UPI001E362631|nr:PLD nuclease N-terminal domain-containing protein [Nocardioides sp. cx-173]MCD4523877.1 PLD nuclease N-terminal domain-containing protein [Nocardioides sp. cx-173]UGB41804.1 PLD nuclease N-terminal domain-containing protein [Nocardioides sp. cx-173]